MCVVIIDAGVPGIRISVAVTRPPLTLPTYIDTSKLKASLESIEKVSGSTSAINMAPVKPGMAPTTIPRIEPITTITTACGCSRDSVIAVSSDITHS